MKSFCFLIFNCVVATVAATPESIQDYDAAMIRLDRKVRPQFESALVAVRRAADEGHPPALLTLAHLYSNGVGEPRSPDDKSINLFRRALDAGRLLALGELEKRLRVGLGTPIDLLESCAYYFRMRSESELGNEAISRAAQLPLHPERKTIEKLDALFEAAFRDGNRAALLELAKLHAKGTYGHANPARACALLMLARASEAAARVKELDAAERKKMEKDLEWMR